MVKIEERRVAQGGAKEGSKLATSVRLYLHVISVIPPKPASKQNKHAVSGICTSNSREGERKHSKHQTAPAAPKMERADTTNTRQQQRGREQA